MKLSLKNSITVLILCCGLQIAFAELRDPTRPDYYTGEGNSQFRLTAILISKERKIAIINNQFVTVGDKIGDNKIALIAPNTVQLDGPNGRMTLFLIDPALKKTRTSVP